MLGLFLTFALLIFFVGLFSRETRVRVAAMIGIILVILVFMTM